MVIACGLALAGCGEGGAAADAQVDVGVDAAPEFRPSLPVVLTADREGSHETPALLAARDGSIYLAWSADGQIGISRTTDGASWSAPTIVTADSGGGREPALYQDADGVIHAAWMRAGRIMYAHAIASDSIAEWSSPLFLTPSGLGDAAPSITMSSSGEIVVAFARTTCTSSCGIMSTTSVDGGATWETPLQVISSGSAKHHLPSLANLGSELVLAWNVYDASAAVPWESTMTQAYVSTIRRGSSTVWGAQQNLTTYTGAVTTFPNLYTDHAGEWQAAYARSYMAGSSTVTSVRSVPLATPTAEPREVPVEHSWQRIVATPTPGMFLGAWEDGLPESRNIIVRVFTYD